MNLALVWTYFHVLNTFLSCSLSKMKCINIVVCHIKCFPDNCINLEKGNMNQRKKIVKIFICVQLKQIYVKETLKHTRIFFFFKRKNSSLHRYFLKKITSGSGSSDTFSTILSKLTLSNLAVYLQKHKYNHWWPHDQEENDMMKQQFNLMHICS